MVDLLQLLIAVWLLPSILIGKSKKCDSESKVDDPKILITPINQIKSDYTKMGFDFLPLVSSQELACSGY